MRLDILDRLAEGHSRRFEEALRLCQEENARWLEEHARRLAEIRGLLDSQVERK
jgi:hypothetical protein